MDNNLYLQNGEYKYKGQPLRPGIMAEILLQLFGLLFKDIIFLIF